MMKKLSIIYTILISLCVISCFDDKGNYDYKNIEINKITITFPSYTVSAYLGEPVVFKPRLRYANTEQADTNIYTWEYRFDYVGVVCTERDMNVIIEDAIPGRSYDGVVVATDITTGAKYTQNIGFTYKSPYTTGWLLLADNSGKSQLHLARELNEVWSKVDNLYQTIHQKELGTKPVRVILNHQGRDEVRIMQEGPEGCLVLEGTNYAYVCNFSDEFVGEQLPANFIPTSFGAAANVAVMLGENGDLYTKTFDYDTYSNSLFTSVPHSYGTQKLNVQYILSSSYLYDLQLYDKASHRFFMVYGASYWDAGSLYVIKPPEDWDKPEVPTPDNMSGYEILDCQIKNPNYYDSDCISLIKKTSTQKLFIYTFSFNASSRRASNITYEEFTASALVGEHTLYSFLRRRPYLFFTPEAAPTQLYCYDLRTKTSWMFKNFGAKITSIHPEYFANNRGEIEEYKLGVALENGEFYLQDIRDETFISGKDSVVYHATFPGKIVDIKYKQY